MAGDFNAKCEEWFAGQTDRRGALLLEFSITNRLILMNNSVDATHFHRRFGSHVNITFALENLAHHITGPGDTRRGINERPQLYTLYLGKAGCGHCL